MDPPDRAPSTIDDVAARARCSISTVSRVLNGRDRVHPETRARVLAAVRDLSYQPSALARGLATRATHTLGFVIPNISDPFFYEIVRGVEEVAAAAGYNLLVVSQPHAADHRYLQLFTQRRVDGLILGAIAVRRADIQRILHHGFPAVLMQQDLGSGVPAVLVDNYGGAGALAAHLLGHGYRRVAYITGTDSTPDSAERLRGLRDTLAAQGHALPAERIVVGDYLRGSGYRAMLQLLDRPERPDAVFAANDQMAGDALLAARERGLRVPEDLALVGFDDIPLAGYITPPLTTVHQPAYDLGAAATRLVLQALHCPPGMARIVLPVRLVVRRSCGCTG